MILEVTPAQPQAEPQTPGTAIRQLVVRNKMGLHARPAAMIVRLANLYSDVELFIEKDGERINGKSIMGLMMLAAAQGSKLRFITVGGRGEALLEKLEALFEKRFEEA